MVLVVVSLLVPVAERFRLPHTVLLAIAGMGLGFLGSWMINSGVKLGALGDAFVGLDKLEVGADMFLPLFLPPLLFTAGLNIEVRRLMDEVHACCSWPSSRWSSASPRSASSCTRPPAWTSWSACCWAPWCRPPIRPP